jgi:hypothetical protein
MPGVALCVGINTQIAQYTALFGYPRVSPVQTQLLHRLHAAGTRTLVPSQSVLDGLVGQGFERSSFRLWPGGVDEVRFHPSKCDRALRRKWLGLDDGASNREKNGEIGDDKLGSTPLLLTSPPILPADAISASVHGLKRNNGRGTEVYRPVSASTRRLSKVRTRLKRLILVIVCKRPLQSFCCLHGRFCLASPSAYIVPQRLGAYLRGASTLLRPWRALGIEERNALDGCRVDRAGICPTRL